MDVLGEQTPPNCSCNKLVRKHLMLSGQSYVAEFFLSKAAAAAHMHHPPGGSAEQSMGVGIWGSARSSLLGQCHAQTCPFSILTHTSVCPHCFKFFQYYLGVFHFYRNILVNGAFFLRQKYCSIFGTPLLFTVTYFTCLTLFSVRGRRREVCTEGSLRSSGDQLVQPAVESRDLSRAPFKTCLTSQFASKFCLLELQQ